MLLILLLVEVDGYCFSMFHNSLTFVALELKNEIKKLSLNEAHIFESFFAEFTVHLNFFLLLTNCEIDIAEQSLQYGGVAEYVLGDGSRLRDE